MEWSWCGDWPSSQGGREAAGGGVGTVAEFWWRGTVHKLVLQVPWETYREAPVKAPDKHTSVTIFTTQPLAQMPTLISAPAPAPAEIKAEMPEEVLVILRDPERSCRVPCLREIERKRCVRCKPCESGEHSERGELGTGMRNYKSPMTRAEQSDPPDCHGPCMWVRSHKQDVASWGALCRSRKSQEKRVKQSAGGEAERSRVLKTRAVEPFRESLGAPKSFWLQLRNTQLRIEGYRLGASRRRTDRYLGDVQDTWNIGCIGGGFPFLPFDGGGLFSSPPPPQRTALKPSIELHSSNEQY